MKKNDIERKIKDKVSKKGYKTLRLVLFDKDNRLPYAVHFFDYNNKYYIENRDEKGELIGNPYILDNLEEAEKRLFEVLKQVVFLNKYYFKNFGEAPYNSPLWSNTVDTKQVKQKENVYPVIVPSRNLIGKYNVVGKNRFKTINVPQEKYTNIIGSKNMRTTNPTVKLIGARVNTQQKINQK